MKLFWLVWSGHVMRYWDRMWDYIPVVVLQGSIRYEQSRLSISFTWKRESTCQIEEYSVSQRFSNVWESFILATFRINAVPACSPLINKHAVRMNRLDYISNALLLWWQYHLVVTELETNKVLPFQVGIISCHVKYLICVRIFLMKFECIRRMHLSLFVVAKRWEICC